MIEKDMEDLIAAYPDDFFFQKQFVLVGRQQSLAGVGRFDLLFEDRFKSTILMELKARTLKYEDATQVANYRDELKRNGRKNIVMWLVAPQIPNSVREFLDDKGIEYTEIHFAEFRRVAERHDFVIKNEGEQAKTQPAPSATRRTTRAADRSRDRSFADMAIREANERLGSEWTVRDLAEALKATRSSTLRRLKKWIASAKVQKISAGKKGPGGCLARYRFVGADFRKSWHEGTLAQQTKPEMEQEQQIPRVKGLMRDLFVADARKKGLNLGGGVSLMPPDWFIENLPNENPELIRRAYECWSNEIHKSKYR